MSSSVAGQIRIDLIAQAAQFTAGIREGEQELGSFQEQFERVWSFRAKRPKQPP